MPSDYLAALGDPVPAEVLAECGVPTVGALAFTARSQRLLLRQIATPRKSSRRPSLSGTRRRTSKS